MTKVVCTPAAERDLIGIAAWIAPFNGFAAYTKIDLINAVIEQLQRSPMMGESVESFRQGMRRITESNCVVYHRVLENHDTIEICRVVYGACGIDDLFP